MCNNIFKFKIAIIKLMQLHFKRYQNILMSYKREKIIDNYIKDNLKKITSFMFI